MTLAGICLAIFILFAVSIISESKHFLYLQLEAGDALIGLTPQPRPPLKMALVALDQSSALVTDHVSPEELAASPILQIMSHGMPFESRAVYAAAIEVLMQAGAKLVFLDVLMLSPREGDGEMRRVLEKYRNRVVLVSNFGEEVVGSNTVVRYQTPSESMIPDSGANIGFASIWRDMDGVLRKMPFRIRVPGSDGKMANSASAEAIKLLGAADRAANLPDEACWLPIPALTEKDIVPLWQLFTEKTLGNLRSSGLFQDSVVAIGAYTSQEHNDIFDIPARKGVSGMEVHLNAMGAAWQNALYQQPLKWESVAAALLAVIIVWSTSMQFPGVLLRSSLLLLVLAALVPAGMSALWYLKWMPPVFAFGGCLVFSGIACGAWDFILENRERQRTRQTLERYVSPNLAREILDHRAEFLQDLGGARREVTIAFSDLRGFTSLSEQADATELLSELNEYLGSMVEVIFAHGGGVDKFLGDGIMAVWGNISSRGAEEEAIAALTCVQKMQETLKTLNVGRVARGLKSWNAGIGLHSGNVIFGNVGSLQKMEPTVIGDTVNLASRTEGLTKQYGTSILFTESTALLAAKLGPFRAVDRVRVVGRVKPVDLFAIWNDEEETFRILWEKALSLYREGLFSEAVEAFQETSAINSDDSLCRLYIRRSKALVENPPKDSWDGVFTATLK